MRMRPFKTALGSKGFGRSKFDLSYSKLFTTDAGQLQIVQCDEVVPGDSFRMGSEIVVRSSPMNAPILHEVNIYSHTFSSLIGCCGTMRPVLGKNLLPAVLMGMIHLCYLVGFPQLILKLNLVLFGICVVFQRFLLLVIPLLQLRFLSY